MGAEWSLFPVIKEMEDTERLLCPGAPQGHAWFQLQVFGYQLQIFWLCNWLRVTDNICSTVSRNVKVLILQSCSQCLIVQKYISVPEQWAGSCRLPRWLSGKEFAGQHRRGRRLILGQEDPLEEEVETHSSILAGKSHAQRSLLGYSLWGLKELNMT